MIEYIKYWLTKEPTEMVIDLALLAIILIVIFSLIWWERRCAE